jgi:hypothetical protein
MPLLSTLGSTSARAYGFGARVVSPPSILTLAFNVTPSDATEGPINNYYRRYVYKVIYTAAELNAAGWVGSQTIRRLSFFVTSQPIYQPYPNYAIGMTNTALAVGSDFTTGITAVLNQSSRFFTAGIENIFTLNTAFTWNGTDNLGISFAWGQCPTNYSLSGVVRSNTSGSGRYDKTDSAGTYLITSVATGSVSGRPCITLYNTL